MLSADGTTKSKLANHDKVTPLIMSLGATHPHYSAITISTFAAPKRNSFTVDSEVLRRGTFTLKYVEILQVILTVVACHFRRKASVSAVEKSRGTVRSLSIEGQLLEFNVDNQAEPSSSTLSNSDQL